MNEWPTCTHNFHYYRQPIPEVSHIAVIENFNIRDMEEMTHLLINNEELLHRQMRK